MNALPTRIPDGTVIERRYEVRGLLGVGTQGVVYRVYDLNLRSEGAMKLLTGAPVGPIWQEAFLLRNLSGVYLLPVLDANLASGVPFIVTVIAEHGTVMDQLDDMLAIPTQEAIRWSRQASRALGRLHEAGLVHNDLKPDNLFLDAQKSVLVGDLGFAAKLDGNGLARALGCTPSTAAPEIARAALASPDGQVRPASARSDVYSLGATLYWLLAGFPPFDEATPLETLSAVCAGPPAQLRHVAPHVPPALSRVVEKAMAREPSGRFESMSELDHALGLKNLVERSWSRIAPHSGHHMCYLGEKGKSVLSVCVETEEGGAHHQVSVRYLPSGRRKGTSHSFTTRQLPTELRKVFKQNP